MKVVVSPSLNKRGNWRKAGKNRYIAWICTGAVRALLAALDKFNALSVPSPLAFVSDRGD